MLIFAVIGGVLFLLHFFFGIFDSLIIYLNQDITKLNSTLSSEVVAGISIGGVLLVAFIVIFPLFMKGIKKKQYFVSLQRGIISSMVFYFSTLLYQYTENISRFFLLLSVVIVMLVTVIMIEIVTLSMKEAKQAEFRTDVVSAIASGLAFGVLLKLIVFSFDFLKHSVK
jgi:hypothetical protein